MCHVFSPPGEFSPTDDIILHIPCFPLMPASEEPDFTFGSEKRRVKYALASIIVKA